MERLLTSEELRTAARQAITLAYSVENGTARDDLLMRARRLLEEADKAA